MVANDLEFFLLNWLHNISMVDAVKIVFLKFLDVKQIYITNHIKTPNLKLIFEPDTLEIYSPTDRKVVNLLKEVFHLT